MSDLPPPSWPSADEPDDEGPSFSESLEAPSGSSSGSSRRAFGLGIAALGVLTVLGLGAGAVLFAAPFGTSYVEEVVQVGGEAGGGGGVTVGDEVPSSILQRGQGATTPGDELRSGLDVAGVVDARPVAHPLALASARRVDLRVVAAEFDTVLAVLDDAGRVVASNDDAAGDLRSRIRTDLPAGSYEVRVFGYSASDSGAYELSFD